MANVPLTITLGDVRVRQNVIVQTPRKLSRPHLACDRMSRMGGEAWSSLVAVAGTLLGAAVTYFFQKQQADRSADRARKSALREERLAAFEAFAGTLIDFRRGSYDRAYRELESDPHDDAYRATSDEYYRLRSAAQHALLRIRLICDDPTVINAADRAFEVAETVHEAHNEQAIQDAGDLARSALDAFIHTANANVRVPR